MEDGPGLNRSLVLQTALRMVDEEGLDALSMRRLATRLGCSPMALYRYATGRAELLDGVVETVFALFTVADGDDWRDALRETAHSFRRVALLHPNVVPLLATRPLATPLGLRPLGTLRPLEQILQLLQDAGLAPTRALHLYRAYFGLLLGHVLTELQELVAHPEETDALLRLGLHRLPPAEFPAIRALADDLAAYDGAAELDRSVTTLLAGLSRPEEAVEH